MSPVTQGKLIQGHVLLSNFNDKANEQGTGTTIVQIGPGGTLDLFAQIDAQNLPGPCPGGVATQSRWRGQTPPVACQLQRRTSCP